MKHKDKYKVGDKVKMRNYIIPDISYGKATLIEEMMLYTGKTLTIAHTHKDGSYYIYEDNLKWFWTEEMIEPAITIPPSIKINGEEYV